MTPPLTFRSWLIDTAERSLVSLLQAVLLFVPTIAGAWNASVLTALAIAGFQAVGAVLVSALATLAPPPTTWALDTLFRVGRTFLVSVLSLATAAQFDLFSAEAWQAATIAAGMAALTVAKALFAGRQPGRITPASLASR